MNFFVNYFRNLKIKFKLLIGYTFIFVIATLLGGSVIFFTVRDTIETNIESELTNATSTILNMVRTAASTSIKNHLKAVAEKNKEIVAGFYKDFKNGKITEVVAKSLSRKVLFSQTIGKTGYIFCANSKGIAEEHPNPGVAGKNFMNRNFVKHMMRMKQGYLEYDWKNPEDKVKKPKAMYMSYFKEWDWIIAATSYRYEFIELIDISDFKDSILGLKYGNSGYTYISDSKGNLLVHPFLKGNYYNKKDKNGNYFVRDICRQKSGKLTYAWKNPGDKTEREKMVIFNYIPEYDWIIASAVYHDEIYKPLVTIGHIFIATILIIIAFVSLASLGINRSVINPLKSLMSHLHEGASGNLKVRMPVRSKDEIGELAGYFNDFMEKLENYSHNLELTIMEHKKSEKALKLSEEMFSKAFRSSPSGMFIATVNGTKIINVNDSFLKITGLSMFDIIGRELMTIRFFPHLQDGREIVKKISRRRQKPIEFKFLNADGDKRIGMISAESVDVWGESCLLVAIEDMTEARQLEREILNISEKERQKIAMELHDDLCPQLIGIEVLIKILKEKLDKTSSADAENADKIRSLILDSIDKTRRLSMGLYPINLAEKKFETSLEDLAGYIRDIFNIKCKLSYNITHNLEDNSIAGHLYYIVHEAVHNSVKHANAQSINISLFEESGYIKLKIEDDGTGITGQIETRSIGMKIMQYRATRIGASLDIISDDPDGTVVELELSV